MGVNAGSVHGDSPSGFVIRAAVPVRAILPDFVSPGIQRRKIQMIASLADCIGLPGKLDASGSRESR